MWYVVYGGKVVDADFYSAHTLSKAIALCKVYKACFELSNNRPCHACVVKINERGEWCADNTQVHYM